MKDLSFRDWSFPLKIMAGYLTGILVLIILFSMSIHHLGAINGDYNAMMNDAWRQLDCLQTIRNGALQARLSLPGDPKGAQRGLEQIDTALNQYFRLEAGGIPFDLVVLVTDISNFRRQICLLGTGRGSLPALTKAFNVIEGRTRYEVERSRAKTIAAEANYLERINQLLLLNILLAPLSFLFFYYYGYMLANMTGLRLRHFLAVLREIAGGNTGARLKVDSEDEIGQIAAEVNKLADKIEKGYNNKT